MGNDIELGPIDYLVVEYPDGRPTGEALPYLLDLVDRGIVRILDVGFILKDPDGQHRRIERSDVEADDDSPLAVFEGAATGLLSSDDLDQVATVIGEGSAAGVLVYEDCWAGPFATALRRAGAQLVASGRIPVQAVLAALEAESDARNEQ